MKKVTLILFVLFGVSAIKLEAQATKSPETTATFSIADSASYMGKYKFEGLPFEYLEVSVRDNRLYFVGGTYNGFLVPQKVNKDIFDVNDVAVFSFNRDDQKRVAELKIDYEGETYFGKKVEKKANQ